MLKLYEKKLKVPRRIAKIKAILLGSVIGVLFMVIFAILSIIIYVGANMIDNGDLSVENMYKCLFSLIFGAFGMATASVILPDLGKAAVSLERIFAIIDTHYDIDARKEDGFIPKKEDNFKGEIEFKNVYFNYPSRPD